MIHVLAPLIVKAHQKRATIVKHHQVVLLVLVIRCSLGQKGGTASRPQLSRERRRPCEFPHSKVDDLHEEGQKPVTLCYPYLYFSLMVIVYSGLFFGAIQVHGVSHWGRTGGGACFRWFLAVGCGPPSAERRAERLRGGGARRARVAVESCER